MLSSSSLSLFSLNPPDRQPPLTLASQAGRTGSTPFGQSAAAFIAFGQTFTSSCTPLDSLLENGLPRGHILELSGPPGTAKEALAVRFARGAVESDRGVLFVDMQNMTSAASLRSETAQTNSHLIHHLSIFALHELISFLYNLPAFLDQNTSISLLILNSISFPFQTVPDLTMSSRTSVLLQIKQILTRLCAARNLSIVITSQMSTKLLKPDGTPANFDTGSRAVLVPQLGNAYLPLGRAYRVVIVPQTRTSGVLRLLSSPRFSGEVPSREAEYEMIAGTMQSPRS